MLWTVFLLLYVAWYAYSWRLKDSALPLGSDLQAQWVHAICVRIGQLIGLSFSVEERHGIKKGIKGTYLTIGAPHGAFPASQVGLGMTMFRVKPPSIMERCGGAHRR